MRTIHEYPFEEASVILKAAAHPVRLKILALLEDKSMKVGDIQRMAGVKQSITSQHLAELMSRGILGRERKGNEVYYHIKKKEVLGILSCIKKCCKN